MRKMIGLIMVSVLAIGCDKADEKSNEAKSARMLIEHQAQFSSFAVRHGALEPWFKGVVLGAHTYEYQTALMRSQTQSLAFEATLQDVVIESGQVVGQFWLMEGEAPMLHLHLRLDAAGIQVVKRMSKDVDSCFLVAKDLNSRAESDKNGGVELVAEGVCLVLEKR